MVKHEAVEMRDCVLQSLDQVLSGLNQDIEKAVCNIIELIGEIDAVGGPNSFYIPDELKPYLDGRRTKYRVRSGSLWYLAEPEHYIDELYPVTPGEKDSYGFLAFCVNRTKYYAGCGHKEKLIEFEGRVRSCYIRLRKHIIQSMPIQLSDEDEIYVTEVAERIGKLMMGELVEMHREFIRYYGPDTDGLPKWMEGDKLNELLSMLQKPVTQDEGKDLTSLIPLYSSLKENAVILFLDFSSLNDMDEDNEKLDEHAMNQTDSPPHRHSVLLRDDGVDADEKIPFLCNNDDITEEIERISYICSCIIDAIKSGGSVLIPIGRLGAILLLLELISGTLHSSSIKVPIFMISETAEEIIAFTNALPEWLCKSRQEKLFSGEALFGHVELLKEGKLFLFPHLHSKSLLAEWKEPCIVFCPHWSLRLGPAVHLLRRRHADKRCLLVLEQGDDAELTLKPSMPLAIQVLECSFLSRVRAAKIDTLLGALNPKFVMLPEGLKSRYSVKERPCSFLYYSKGKTIELPNIREDFEVHLATDVAHGLQPRKLNETTAVARLRTKLLVSSGKYQLAIAGKLSDQSKRHLLHRDAVDPDRLLAALQEKGMVCSFAADDNSAGERSVLITSPGDALVKITSDRTVIYCDDERISKHIYDALSSVCNGI
ncbi:hypothetical protein C2845_PM13G19970 [Panicum miliaceum]|uniref:Beta-Casp domain-containing protein n=1 Tax=Panicum miliaceum TaxID=4540 RepID=A0A3L6RKA0_PANMI|nr:hypothetical protein C2845_PM13G19970 [Panicum miliaceum]